jgi:2-dehydropantoate 2-reductase
MIEKIGIVGVGGVGGYFGGKLCGLKKDNDRLMIAFVARGEQLRAIQESGLMLSSEDEGEILCQPSLATADFEALPALDLCLLCVKEFDLPAALLSLKRSVRQDTIILPLLNGVDVYSRVRKIIKAGMVLPACVYVGPHVERPGKVKQRGGACKILFGPDPERPDFEPGGMMNLFRAAGIKSEWTLKIDAEIWKKFIFICAYGMVSAARDKTLGQILEDHRMRSDVESLILEAVALATPLGIELTEGIVEESLLRAGQFPYEAKTSFQRDFERMDKNDERDLFCGTMMRLGTELGIAVPKTREFAAVLEQRKPVLRRS